MKKRILFNIHYLEIGGAETSLIGLLHSLSPADYDVDLLVNDPRGELMKYIPSWVNLILPPPAYSFIERPILQAVKNGHLKLAAARLWAKYKFGKYVKKNQPASGDAVFGYVGKYVSRVLPSLSHLGEYDVAVSYVTPHDIVSRKVSARKKIAWIHTDYSKIDVNAALELPVWNSFDKIVSISPDVTTSYLQVFPTLKDKIVEIENFLPIELIKNKAVEFPPEDMPEEKGIINLLTIGRFCEAKRIDEIPAMARILKDSGIRFRWSVIGYGSERILEDIKRNIITHGVQNQVIILGKKENPYPYIKACHVYVQPSRYEGKSITVREAQLLGKPVVITNYPTSSSQLQHGVDGFIGPYDTIPFAHYLGEILAKKHAFKQISENLNNKDFSQQPNLQKFLSL